MNEIDVHHLAAAYALDALDDRERTAFEAHYGSCEVCRTDVLEFRRTMTHVAGSLATVAPPALKERVLAEVAATRQLSPTVAPVVEINRRRNAGRSLMGLAAAAAAVLMIVAGVVVFRGGDDTTYADALARVLEQPDAQMIELQNQSGTTGSFKVAWSGSIEEAVLIGEDLPAAPDDKAYELWLITPDQAMAMYVLDSADDGNVHRSLKASQAPTAWAITVEPAEGSATATGDIIFVGEV